MGSKTQAGIGFRTHTGWAAAVAVSGTVSSPQVIDRRRIVLAPKDGECPGAVYHAAQGLPLPAAEKLVSQATESARRMARAAIQTMITDLRAKGYEAVASGIVLGGGRLPSSLEAILRSHPLVHTAEGELFRQALIGASEACGLTVTPVRREVYDMGSKELGIRVDALRDRVAQAGRDLGKPWGQDEKESMLAAWLSLALVSSHSRRGSG